MTLGWGGEGLGGRGLLFQAYQQKRKELLNIWEWSGISQCGQAMQSSVGSHVCFWDVASSNSWSSGAVCRREAPQVAVVSFLRASERKCQEIPGMSQLRSRAPGKSGTSRGVCMG